MLLNQGFLRLEEMFKKHGKAVDDLKEIAKVCSPLLPYGTLLKSIQKVH